MPLVQAHERIHGFARVRRERLDGASARFKSLN
jgi:hypothetical protein